MSSWWYYKNEVSFHKNYGSGFLIYLIIYFIIIVFFLHLGNSEYKWEQMSYFVWWFLTRHTNLESIKFVLGLVEKNVSKIQENNIKIFYHRCQYEKCQNNKISYFWLTYLYLDFKVYFRPILIEIRSVCFCLVSEIGPLSYRLMLLILLCVQNKRNNKYA